MTELYKIEKTDYLLTNTEVSKPSHIVLAMETMIINRMRKKLKLSKHTALGFLRKKTNCNAIETSYYLNIIVSCRSKKALASVFGITLEERNY